MNVFSPRQFLKELQRRRVFSTVVAYVIGAWVAVQAADLAFPGFDIPQRAIAYVWLGALLLLPLVLLLGWKYDIHITGIKRTTGLGEKEELDTSLQKPDRWLIGGVCAVALTVIAGILIIISRMDPADFEEITPNSIAVMPFNWCAERAEDIALAGGIHAAVINRLASRERLKVIGRNSVHNIASVGVSNDRVLELLRVQFMLHGELCREGSDLVLHAELTDRDETIVWGGSFRQIVRDDQVEQQLASLVANGIALELGDVSRSSSRAVVNVRALELLRTAQYHGDNENWEEAEGLLEEALEYEPNFAEAIFELARAKANQGQVTGNNPDSYLAFIEIGWPLGENALALARQEIERNPTDFQPYSVAARILIFMSWWHKEVAWRESVELGEAEIARRMDVEIEMLREAEGFLRNAIRLNPSDSNLREELAWTLERQGPERRGEVLDIIEQARRTEPFDEQVATLLARNLALRGQYERAMEELERFEALGEISNYIRAEQLEIQRDYGRQDDRLELLLRMLQHETEKFSRVQNALAHLFWVSSDMPYLGLDQEAEMLHQKLKAIPERSDARSWELWARQFFLIDKYRQSTGQAEEANEDNLAEVEGMSNKEIIDRWSLRVQIYAMAFWESGERDRAIELYKPLRHHRASPRWPQRAMGSKLTLAGMYLAEGRNVEAAPILEEIVDYIETELAAGVRHPMVLFNLASAYAGQGHHDEAFEVLSMAADYGCDYLGLGANEESADEEHGDHELGGIMWRALYEDKRFERERMRQVSMIEQQAANIRSLLATHDMDLLLNPVIEMHTFSENFDVKW